MRIPSIWECPKCKKEDKRCSMNLSGCGKRGECHRCGYIIGTNTEYDAVIQKVEDDVMRMKQSLYPFIPEVPIAQILAGEGQHMMDKVMGKDKGE